MFYSISFYTQQKNFIDPIPVNSTDDDTQLENDSHAYMSLTSTLEAQSSRTASATLWRPNTRDFTQIDLTNFLALLIISVIGQIRDLDSNLKGVFETWKIRGKEKCIVWIAEKCITKVIYWVQNKIHPNIYRTQVRLFSHYPVLSFPNIFY